LAEVPDAIVAFDRGGVLAEAADALATTRRRLLGLAIGGAAGAALGGAGVARASAASAHDVGILNYALSLEYLQASFYTEAERIGALHGPLAQQAHVVGAHERAHVAAFRRVLGSAAMKRPTFDFRGVTEDPDAFRRTAVAFEDLAVAAYKYEAPHLQSPAFLSAAVAIHSVEARHAAWIRRLAGVLPAATAFDEPLAPPKVKALVASTRFVVGSPQMTSHHSPKFTG
jgi:Ferritin-like domain